MKKRFKLPHFLLILFIFAAGLAVRIADLDDPPLDFHPARQMHSALMARAFYLKKGPVLEGLGLEYTAEAMSRGLKEPWIEPPIYEKLTAKLYEVFHSPDLRIPRLTSILFWLLGGLALWRLCGHFCGIPGRFCALAWFLCFPYGIIASRSFQPDIPMVWLILLSLAVTLQWGKRPGSPFWAITAGICCGFTILVKQVAAFPLGLALAAFCLNAFGLKGALKNPWVWVVAFLSLAPMLIYNYWGLFIKGFLAQQYQGRFFLSELISPSFYVRWMRMLDEVFTIPLILGAVIGLFLIREKTIRALWIGYLAGYILYGLTLPHHIGTHNYYQLILFPAAAAGLGVLGDCLFSRVELLTENRAVCRIGVFALLALLNGWWIADSVMTLHRKDYRAWPERWIALAKELETYPGSISTIGIMDDYGGGMTYWGLHNPMIWDSSVETMSEEDALYTLNTTFWNYRYLVVTDLAKFYEQPRLQRYIQENGTIYRQEADHLIFKLWDNE